MNALNALQATVAEGHVDLFGQLYRDSSDKLAVVTAMRVVEGETLAVGLRDMLMRIIPANDARGYLSRVVPSLLIEGMTLAGN